MKLIRRNFYMRDPFHTCEEGLFGGVEVVHPGFMVQSTRWMFPVEKRIVIYLVVSYAYDRLNNYQIFTNKWNVFIRRNYFCKVM